MLNSQLFLLPQHISQRENSDKATTTTSVRLTCSIIQSKKMVKLSHYLIKHHTMTLHWELEAKFHTSTLALLVYMCYEVKHVTWTPCCHGMASPWLALWGGQKLTTP